MTTDTSPPTVRLRKRKARPVWAGHPWIYSGAVAARTGAGDAGTLVAVQDETGNHIGFGHLSPSGPITVRMLTLGADAPHEGDLLQQRLRAAHARRLALGLPSGDTNAYRLVHGEGDRLPGLVVDRLANGVVIQLGTAAWQRLSEQVVAAVRELVSPEWVVLQVPADAAAFEGLSPSARVAAGDEETVAATVVTEGGLRFATDPLGGQKTGFYADQRANRLRVSELAKGRKVLDAFSYSGGFGLYALARGGAASATSVDTSPRAIALADRSAALNAQPLETVCGDAMVYMREAAPARGYDLVVLDPPKFARSRAHVDDALRKYRKLNELALSALVEGGILVSCSCSGHITSDDFVRMLSDAAFAAGRHLHVIEERGQATDHPFLATCPEGRYLKCVVAQVSLR